MNFVRIANNAYSCAKLAKNVGSTVYGVTKIGTKEKEPPVQVEYIIEQRVVELPCEHKRSNRRLLTDIGVLQTMLERIVQSENEDLLSEIEKHQIPERIEELAVLVAKLKERGFRTLCSAEIRELDYVVEEIECIYKQTKALILASLLSQSVSMRF